MRFKLAYLVMFILLLQGVSATAKPAEDPENLLLIADSSKEAALAVSTGAEVVYGSGSLREELKDGKEVYEIGEDRTSHPEIAPGDIPELVGASTGHSCPENPRKRIYTALMTSLDDDSVVCAGGKSKTGASLDRLRQDYVERLSERGEGVNHIIVSSPRMAPVAASIASDQDAYLEIAGSRTPETEKLSIDAGEDWIEEADIMDAEVEGGNLVSRSSGVIESFEKGSLKRWNISGNCAGGVGLTEDRAVRGDRSLELSSDWIRGGCTAVSSIDVDVTGGGEISYSVMTTGDAGKVYLSGPKGSFRSKLSSNELRLRTLNADDYTLHQDLLSSSISRGEWYNFTWDFREDEDVVDVEVSGPQTYSMAMKAPPGRKFDHLKLLSSGYTSYFRQYFDSFVHEGERKGNWTSRVLEGEERVLESVQVDVESVPGDAEIWAVVEGGGEKEVKRLTEPGEKNISTGIHRFDSLRLSFNLTGEASIDSVEVFHRDKLENSGGIEKGSGSVRDRISQASEVLAGHGMYTSGREQYTEGLYLSLTGVPGVRKEDPVEAGNWSLDDPRDGDYYISDLDYGDLDHDGRVEAAVGRYPANRSLASRMYLRSKYYSGKEALVASEYLHQNWPVILAYLGGGMFSGKSVENVLEEQGYNVSRAVEYRASPEELLVDLTPHSLRGVISDSGEISDKVGSVLGSSVGTAASQVYLAVKALNYVERGLEQYLEFDWSTAGLDLERAGERLSDTEASELEDSAVRSVKRVSERGVSKGLVETLQEEGVQESVAKAVYAFFWPDRYPELTEENLRERLRDKEMVYYTGVGNGSAWILPGNYSSSLGMINTGRYNGSESFYPREVPESTARLVFDNSDLAGEMNSSLREAFLKEGAAGYVGTSTVNYAPFSSEIDSRFFRRGYTVGQSLRKSVNGLAEDSLTWDPVNMVARNNVKGKMIRSFRLYGNPEMGKDPGVQEPEFQKDIECREGECDLTLELDTNFSVVERGGERTIQMDSGNHLLRSFRPIVPVFRAEHAIPAGAEVKSHSLEAETRKVRNVSVPVVEPLSHGGDVLDGEVPEGWFPVEDYRFNVSEEMDGRRTVSLVHPGFRYSPGNDTAEVVENVRAEISYTTPYAMDIDTDDAEDDAVEIDLRVWNRGDADNGELLVQIEGREEVWNKTVDVELDGEEIRSRIPFRLNRSGKFESEIYLFTGNHTVGPRKDTVLVSGDEARLNLSIPDKVQEGEKFWATVKVRNIREKVRTMDVSFNGSEGVQPVFLQPYRYIVEVPAEGERSLRVPFRAFDPGEAELAVSTGEPTESEKLEVVETGAEGFDTGEKGEELHLKRSRGRITVGRDGERTGSSLVTGEFRVEEQVSGGKTVIEAERDEGSVRVLLEEGDREVVERNGLGLQEADRLYQILLREEGKLVERYRLSDTGSTRTRK